MSRARIGLIVNPIAGLGGRVGLKGTDGPATVRRAMEMGASPESPARAALALRWVRASSGDTEILTFADPMGGAEAETSGLRTTVVGSPSGRSTTPQDTERAAEEMMAARVDLLLFAGGDGTARNVFDAVGERTPCLGIPAGVKIQSAVFATTPTVAGQLAGRFVLPGSAGIRIREAEVMDIDEEAVRADRVSSKLYGYLRVPYERGAIQGAKAGSAAGDEVAMDGIASDVINGMRGDTLYILGPGTTTRAIMQKLGLPKTLLGVDAVLDGRRVGVDLTEKELLDLLATNAAEIIVTAIGGQGHILGRGNQQISPGVIRRVGTDHIVVVATRNKILALAGRPLLVDTGDEELDRALQGHVQVVTGLNERMIYEIGGPDVT
ncbi:MAG: ATP-NAD kinase family protein [Actinomycetota bacterium]